MLLPPPPALLPAGEYGLLWATFSLIMLYGLEAGIGLGVLLAALYFAFEYAQVRVSCGF